MSSVGTVLGPLWSSAPAVRVTRARIAASRARDGLYDTRPTGLVRADRAELVPSTCSAAVAAICACRCDMARCTTEWTAPVPTTAALTATAAIFAATPAEKRPFRAAMREPKLKPVFALPMRRFGAAGSSSAEASVRRARKMSISTAPCDRSSSEAISRYERPCHSRRRIARLWFSGICSSASSRPISSRVSPAEALPDGTISSSISKSSGASRRNRLPVDERRAMQTFAAILYSHACSKRVVVPRCRPRKALRNVVWTASSASSRERS